MDALIPIVTVAAIYVLLRVMLVLVAHRLRARLADQYRFIGPLITPLHLVLLAAAALVGFRMVGSGDSPVPTQLLNLAVAWVAVRLVTTLLYEGWFGTIKEIRLPEVARRLISLALVSVLTLVYLHVGLGLPLTDVAIGAAVAALVLALVLRGLWYDAFLCISMVLERRIALGDWITVDGHSGQIVSLDVRSTTLRNDRGEHIVLPNRRLAELPLSNAGPKSRRATSVEVSVHADVPPSAALAVLAATALRARVTLNEPEPKVLYLGERGGENRFEVAFWLPDTFDVETARSEVRSAIWYSLRRSHLLAGATPSLPREVVRDELAKVPLLQACTAEQIDLLAQRVRTERFGQGELLFRRNEQGNELFLVHQGALEICLPGPDDIEHKVASLGAGDVVGEHSLLGEPRSATVRAAEDSIVLVIDKQAVGDLLLNDPKLAGEIAQTMVKREEHRQTAMREVEARTDRKSRSLTRQIRKFFIVDGA